MSDRPYSPITNEPFKVENYYMQVLIAKLVGKVPTRENYTYTFTIYKGSQSFETSDQIKIPKNTQGSFQPGKCKVNFAVTSYNPGAPHDFSLRMNLNLNRNQVKEVGQYIVQANQYIDQYIETNNGAFSINIDLNEQFAADLQIYVDRNQHGLFRLIRDIKNPRKTQDKDFETPEVSHQRIFDRRRKMDQEAEQERKNSKEKKFARFSPKKDVAQEKQKKNDFINRRRKEEQEKRAQQQLELKKQQEEKKVQQQQKQQQKAEQQKRKIAEMKKQWTIPAAEKFIEKNKTKRVVRKQSNKSSQKAESQKQDSLQGKRSLKIKTSKAVQIETPLSEHLLTPKVLLPLLLVILVGVYFLFFNTQKENQSIGKKKTPKTAKSGKTKNSQK